MNFSAGFVLLLVHLFSLGGSQLSSVALAIGGHLMIDVLLVLLGLRRFTCVHLAAVDAIRDALLLVALALAYFAVRTRLCGPVVLVVIDRTADIVLLLVHMRALFGSQLPAVGRAIILHFVIDVGFARFQVLGLAGSQLSGASSVRNPILLVFRARSHVAHRRIGRPPMIFRCKVRPVRSRRVFVGSLFGGCLHVRLSLVRALPLRRYRSYSAGAAIEAHVAHLALTDNGPVDVGVVDHCGVHVHHRRVIREMFAVPRSANESHSAITESIVHAAIETNVRSPVTGMKRIHSFSPAPVSRRPEETDSRRRNPDSRHPVVTGIAVSPVARGPDVTFRRARRLHVNRQSRWPDMHRNSDSDLS